MPTIRILGQLNAELLTTGAGPGSGVAKYFKGHPPLWTFNSRSGGFTIPYQLRYEDFDVQLECPTVGDYSIDDRVVVERKTYADFATSLVDGRLFPQAAALARCSYRPVILLEGPTPSPCCERRRERALRFRIAKSAC